MYDANIQVILTLCYLRATGWDESSIVVRTGDTGCEETDNIQPEEHAALLPKASY